MPSKYVSVPEEVKSNVFLTRWHSRHCKAEIHPFNTRAGAWCINDETRAKAFYWDANKNICGLRNANCCWTVGDPNRGGIKCQVMSYGIGCNADETKCDLNENAWKVGVSKSFAIKPHAFIPLKQNGKI
eukprot:NODE_3583_length_539_cov_471.183673_g1983_i2.p2 GENE.NODE_3583_length_539_cov_471.183673_g1983_i2~~NODE_3583_length_539_cov_471.183673_g1983_i2.p2  ORF type:complete len:146 (+),score=50.33 NODE_3583_length_539_cov_471.183673_g1983_i2:52-438(+)